MLFAYRQSKGIREKKLSNKTENSTFYVPLKNYFSSIIELREKKWRNQNLHLIDLYLESELNTGQMECNVIEFVINHRQGQENQMVSVFHRSWITSSPLLALLASVLAAQLVGEMFGRIFLSLPLRFKKIAWLINVCQVAELFEAWQLNRRRNESRVEYINLSRASEKIRTWPKQQPKQHFTSKNVHFTQFIFPFILRLIFISLRTQIHIRITLT